MELVLVHESLHYNAVREVFGHDLEEGLTETGARHLVLKYGLLTPHAVIKENATYERERKGVDLVLDEVVKRTAQSREEATEQFLEAYVTGKQEKMSAVFGPEIWAQIVKLSKTQGAWQTQHIKEVLGR